MSVAAEVSDASLGYPVVMNPPPLDLNVARSIVLAALAALAVLDAMAGDVPGKKANTLILSSQCFPWQFHHWPPSPFS